MHAERCLLVRLRASIHPQWHTTDGAHPPCHATQHSHHQVGVRFVMDGRNTEDVARRLSGCPRASRELNLAGTRLAAGNEGVHAGPLLQLLQWGAGQQQQRPGVSTRRATRDQGRAESLAAVTALRLEVRSGSRVGVGWKGLQPQLTVLAALSSVWSMN